MRFLLYICVHAFAANIVVMLLSLIVMAVVESPLAALCPAAFLLMLIAVPLLLSEYWRPLHEAFPMRPDRKRKRYYMVKAGMGACHYSLNVTVGDAGLTLAAIPMFRLFHPPVHVPWSEVDVCFPDASSTLLVFKRGDIPDLHLGATIEIEGPATDLKDTPSQWPKGWREAALIGQGLTVFASMCYLGFPAFVVVVQLALVVADPTAERLINAIIEICVVSSFIVLFYSTWSIPQTMKFHGKLLKCVEIEPVADDPDDARRVQWCLEHFRLLHRLCCWIRRRDYQAMIAACQHAQMQEPGRALLQPAHGDSPSLFGFCCNFWAEATKNSQQQMGELLGQKRPAKPHDDESNPS